MTKIDAERLAFHHFANFIGDYDLQWGQTTYVDSSTVEAWRVWQEIRSYQKSLVSDGGKMAISRLTEIMISYDERCGNSPKWEDLAEIAYEYIARAQQPAMSEDEVVEIMEEAFHKELRLGGTTHTKAMAEAYRALAALIEGVKEMDTPSLESLDEVGCYEQIEKLKKEYAKKAEPYAIRIQRFIDAKGPRPIVTEDGLVFKYVGPLPAAPSITPQPPKEG